MLGNHVSVKSLVKLQYINYMCFTVHRAVFQGLCCVWSGEGVVCVCVGGGGGGGGGGC